MITIVSGLPRSGTSLMMQILEKAGMEIMSDGVRKADVNNEHGYYEFEKVKALMRDNSWLEEADGKALKVISGLLPFLPDRFEYKILMMRRDINEIISSQFKMLERIGTARPYADPDLLKITFEKQVNDLKKMLSEKKNMDVFEVNYRELVLYPHQEIKKINRFLDKEYDLDRMCTAVDIDLYREKNPNR
jgi:hypothetical protein